MSEDTGITNSFEAMKAELEAAGFEFEHSRSEKEAWIWQAWVVSPDEWLYEAEAYIGSDLEQAQDNAINKAIEKAYAHLQEQRELAALREFVAKVANAEADPLAPNNNWIGHGYNVLMDLRTEAKKLSRGNPQED